MPPEDERPREILDRAARDSETLGSSSMARAGRRLGGHFSGRDAVGQGQDGTTDPAELWGRRIGRALSVVLGLVLTWWLGVQLGWW
ncbi:hypothetical protein [Enterovirga sp.]|jgi:hypothetical protein|uniref:hypothetical protein n=1 Tax=Enterovirga sp. TaxID=2026350 RepID=UPI0026044C1F|nr:hypothetical protein [Enterovirga sp.]MDB5592842.1 hypothetical protein [Enterovirga sp.]